LYILSFDIEDWFHIFDPAYHNKPGLWENLPTSVESNTSWILDFLDENKLKATFFCLGWVAAKYPRLIREISERGHEIAAHSSLHIKVGELDKKSFGNDTEKVIKTLEDLSGQKIDTYRSPGFSLSKDTLWAFEILHQLGITIDSSLKSSTFMGFSETIPEEPFLLQCDGYSIKEFPTRTFGVLGKRIIYSGSGYMRLFPFFFVRNKYRASNYEMAYFHPRDFDEKVHHFIRQHPLIRLKYRIGTQGLKSKLSRLTDEFNFLPIRQAAAQTDWSKAKTLSLLNGRPG